jgi:hypothetical protein
MHSGTALVLPRVRVFRVAAKERRLTVALVGSTELRKAQLRSPSPSATPVVVESRERLPVRSSSKRGRDHNAQSSDRPERERVAHPQAREPPAATRNSDSTQSMLLRSVALQAEAATAALKQASSKQASSTSPSTPERKTSILRRKSSKAVRQGISSPQLVSSSSNMRTVDLPTQLVSTPPSGPSSPALSSTPSRHVRKQSSTSGLRFKVFGKGKGVDEIGEVTPYELSQRSARDSSPESPRSQTHSMPSSSPAQSPSVNTNGPPSGTGLNRLMSMLSRRKGNTESNGVDRQAEDTRQQVKALQGYKAPADIDLTPDRAPIQLSRQVSASKAPSSYVTGIGGFAGSRARRAAVQGDSAIQQPPVPPLVISPRPAQSSSSDALASQGVDAAPGSASSIGDYQSRTNSNARSIDSMRKLWEAANDLGLDPEKVKELVRLSQPKLFEDGETVPGSQIIRRSVIIPSAVQVQPVGNEPHGTGNQGLGPSGHSRTSSLAATGISDPDRLSPRAAVHRRTSSEASISGQGEAERQRRAPSPSWEAPRPTDRFRERPALSPVRTGDFRGALGPSTPSSVRSYNLQVASSPGLMPPSPGGRSARSSVASYEASIFECVLKSFKRIVM